MKVSDRPYEWVLFDQGGTLFEPLPRAYSERNQRLAVRELGYPHQAQAPNLGEVFRVARREADKHFYTRASYLHEHLVTEHLIRGLIGLKLCDDSALDPAHRPAQLQQVAQQYFARQCHDVVTQLRLKPGVHELFARLSARHRLAVVSNNAESYLQPLMRRYRLDRWLDASLSSDALGVCKPHPDIFLRAFDVLGIAETAASRVLYVGDSPAFDIAGASAAGLEVAWLPASTSEQLPQGLKPTITLKSLIDLGAVLEV